MFVIPDFTQPSHKVKEALSWGAMQLALHTTIHVIRTQHESFKFTYANRQEPAAVKEWLGVRLVAYLNRTLLVEAIRFGVYDWSVVVQKCLGLAIQSACSCRTGDAAVIHGYGDEEYLKYKDIALKVSIDRNVPSEYPLLDRVSFKAEITLRYTKGKKNYPSDNHIVVLESLDDPAFNVVDPVKLLLAHALRHDAISGATTPDAVAQQVFVRTDHLVSWKYPNRPVLCAIKARRFDYDCGAKTQQLRESLQEAAKLSEIHKGRSTHDIHRGAAMQSDSDNYTNLTYPRLAAGHALRNEHDATHNEVSSINSVLERFMGVLDDCHGTSGHGHMLDDLELEDVLDGLESEKAQEPFALPLPNQQHPYPSSDDDDGGNDEKTEIHKPRVSPDAKEEIQVLEASPSVFFTWLSQVNTRVNHTSTPSVSAELDPNASASYS